MNIQDEFLSMQQSKNLTRTDIKNFVNKIYTEQNLYKAIDIREFMSLITNLTQLSVIFRLTISKLTKDLA